MSGFVYWIIFLFGCCVVMMYITYDEILGDKLKPKYKLDKNGYLQFYYRRFNCWEYFPIWDNNNEQRYVKVFDRTRNLKYTLSYVGPGRAKIKYTFNDHIQPSRKFITHHFRKIYPEFKSSEQLWNLHESYVNKENAVLSTIIDDHTFIAHETTNK